MNEAAKPIDELIEDLCSKNPATRTRAQEESILRGSQAVPSLVHLLRAPEQHLRREAAKTLEGIADPSAARGRWWRHLVTADSDVSWVAAGALVATGEAALKPLFTRLIFKPDPARASIRSIVPGGAPRSLSAGRERAASRRENCSAPGSRKTRNVAVPAAAASSSRN